MPRTPGPLADYRIECITTLRDKTEVRVWFRPLEAPMTITLHKNSMGEARDDRRALPIRVREAILEDALVIANGHVNDPLRRP